MTILGWDALDDWLKARREESRPVVLTNGCFDLLHVGHVRYLKEARSLGGALLVGLNSDASVRGLKGPGRPVNTEWDRAEVLTALESVDAVLVFDEPTPVRLIEAVRPEVYVKGGDYDPAALPERELVMSLGGRVVGAGLVPGRSTTALINDLKRF